MPKLILADKSAPTDNVSNLGTSQTLDTPPQLSLSNNESSQSSDSHKAQLQDQPNVLGNSHVVDKEPTPPPVGLQELNMFKAHMLERRNTENSAENQSGVSAIDLTPLVHPMLQQ